MKPEETIDFNLRSAWHKIARLYNNEAVKHDITMAMGHVLLNIDARKGTHSTKLGPKMGMESTSLTRILKSMEQKGFIYKETDPSDKRKVKIFITDLGKKKREVSKKTVLALNQSLRNYIEPERLDNFIQVIRDIEEFIDSNEIKKNNEKNN